MQVPSSFPSCSAATLRFGCSLHRPKESEAPSDGAAVACRSQFVHMAEQPLAAEQFAASSLPYSSQPDPYHTGGACLVAEMMVGPPPPPRFLHRMAASNPCSVDALSSSWQEPSSPLLPSLSASAPEGRPSLPQRASLSGLPVLPPSGS